MFNVLLKLPTLSCIYRVSVKNGEYMILYVFANVVVTQAEKPKDVLTFFFTCTSTQTQGHLQLM